MNVCPTDPADVKHFTHLGRECPPLYTSPTVSAAEIREHLRAHGVARADAKAAADAETQKLRALVPTALALGISKSEIAKLAQVSRVTLDAWIDEG